MENVENNLQESDLNHLSSTIETIALYCICYYSDAKQFVLCWILQEQGCGAADANQSEGHESKFTARVSSQRQSRDKTQVKMTTPFIGVFWGVCQIADVYCFTILNYKRLKL